MRFIVFLVLILALVACMVQANNTPDSCEKATCMGRCLRDAVSKGSNRGIGYCGSTPQCECEIV